MKRRDFGLLAGTSLATAATLRTANAQTAADPALLTSTLTPMGAERAGNADGSIPAWTGGLVSPPLPSNQPVAVHLFEDEEPLYTIDSSNMEVSTAAVRSPITRGLPKRNRASRRASSGVIPAARLSAMRISICAFNSASTSWVSFELENVLATRLKIDIAFASAHA